MSLFGDGLEAAVAVFCQEQGRRHGLCSGRP